MKLAVIKIWRAAMFPITSRITCAWAVPGVYRLYYQSRRIGEAVKVDNDALYVSHLFAESGRVVASLADAARWLQAIEDAEASPLAA
jgi:hypothetical protein